VAVPAVASGRQVRRLVVRVLLAGAVVAIVYFGVLPQVADFGDVWATLRAMTWLELVTLLVAAVWNLATYLLPQLAALPGLTVRQAVLESHASTAVGNLVPAGAAIGLGVTWRFYTSYGIERPAIGLSLLIQGVWNNFVKLGMPVVALALLVLTGEADTGKVTVALVGLALLAGALVVFAFALSSERRAERVGEVLAAVVVRLRKLARRPGESTLRDAAVRFRTGAIELLHRRWHWLSAATLLSHLSLFLVLLLALRHVGVSEEEVAWTEALAAFALVRLLSALPITPGGLGVVELGLVGALVLAGGGRPEVVAAVLVFRALTFLLPIPIGAVTYQIWRRAEGRRAAPAAAA
jgi:uncharacterized protein (TIRG00374 family)